ncbi:MAG TPA: hypothetical protein DCZ95_02850 [Verrucomicrobia bacterium]|nr:hypothetical protein [Verrucomicrobiota bacterium]
MGRGAFVLLWALLCGCGTTLVKVQNIPDDHAAYLVKGTLGEVEAQQAIAKRIVVAELARRLEDAPVADARNLPLWQKRLDTLSAPVAIETDRFEQSPELRTVSDRARVTQYIQNHPEQLSLDGSTYSKEWKETLAQAEEQVEKLTADRAQFLKQADAATAARDYLKTLTALAGALEITPDDTALADRSAQAAAAGWTAVKGALEKALLVDAGADPKALDALEKSVMSQQDALVAFVRLATSTRTAKPLLSAERLKESKPLLQRSGEVLGRVWEKSTGLLADRNEFWGVYKYLAARIESAQTRPALKSSGLEAKAKALYVERLVPGMAYFVDAASGAYDQDQYGLSYVFCLMAEEMYDYAVTQKLSLPADAATRLDFARTIEKDDVEKIAAQHTRRLIMLDFLPAVTEEGGQVAYQGRTLCNKKYASANALAWRLNVPQGKVLTQNMVEPLDPADTVISGEIKEITINALPVREYDQQFIEVGSENIVEVVNPLYKIREGQLRTIWQQEVAKFYRIKREHRKEGILSLMLYGEHPGQPPATLLSLNTQFPSTELPLTNLSMQCEEIAFANPISGTPRTATFKDDLVSDPYPQSVPVQLTSDKEITKAVLDFGLSKIDEAIEALVVQYPISKLAEPAMDAQKSGDYAGAAELWGQFSLYIRQLTESTLPEAERETISWTALRGQMEKNLAAWSQSRWKGRDATALQGAANFWANATRDALQAQGDGAK